MKSVSMKKPETPEEIDKFYKESIEDGIKYAESLLGSPINKTPQTGTPLTDGWVVAKRVGEDGLSFTKRAEGVPVPVISIGDDLGGVEWTDEKRKELEGALEVIRQYERTCEKAKQYDIDGLIKLSIDGLTESMDNGTTSGWVEVYPEPLTEQDMHEAAKIGNAAFEYWQEHGIFPKTKDDIKDLL